MPRSAKQQESVIDDTEDVIENESDVEEDESESEVVAQIPAKKKKTIQPRNPTPSTSSVGKKGKKNSGDGEFDLILEIPQDDHDKISNKIKLGTDDNDEGEILILSY